MKQLQRYPSVVKINMTNAVSNTHHQLLALASQQAPSARSCPCLEFEQINYQTAWDLQKDIVNARYEGSINTDIIMILEHAPVFTIGKRGKTDGMMVSETFLKKAGMPVVHIERGGDITYHGPGQIVVYPMIHLEKAKMGVKDYVAALEEIMIRTAGEWNIPAARQPQNRGVWVEERKLGSVGIAVRRGISFHGVALNVNLSLEPFTWINPCGLKGVNMTSMEKELNRKISIKDVRGSIKKHIETVFDIKLTSIKY